MAASPVLVLAALTLLPEAEAAAPEDRATDDTAPPEVGRVTLGVAD